MKKTTSFFILALAILTLNFLTISTKAIEPMDDIIKNDLLENYNRSLSYGCSKFRALDDFSGNSGYFVGDWELKMDSQSFSNEHINYNYGDSNIIDYSITLVFDLHFDGGLPYLYKISGSQRSILSTTSSGISVEYLLGEELFTRGLKFSVSFGLATGPGYNSLIKENYRITSELLTYRTIAHDLIIDLDKDTVQDSYTLELDISGSYIITEPFTTQSTGGSAFNYNYFWVFLIVGVILIGKRGVSHKK